MTRTMALLAAGLVLAACQGHTTARAATPQSVIVQPADVPGMHRCDASGDVNAVLAGEKSHNNPAYDINATEWAQWKRQGAVDAYFAVYGRTAADCAATSDSTTGAPQGGLIVGLVVQFKNSQGAASNFKRESTLLGLGPRDIRFIELAGGSTTFGTATGLGSASVVGSARVAGANYFVAEWQSRTFESVLLGYDMAFADANTAAVHVNRRMQQPD